MLYHTIFKAEVSDSRAIMALLFGKELNICVNVHNLKVVEDKKIKLYVALEE